MILLLVTLILGAAQDSTATAGALRNAEIRIILEDTYAVVLASYEIDRNGDSLVFRAKRLPGQVVLVEGAFGPEDALEQAHRVEERLLIAPPGARGVELFRLRYMVEGDFGPVPIFIPNTAADELEAVRVVVVGATDQLLRHADLDFEPQPDGTHMAMAASLPEIVTLAAARRPLGSWRALFWAALLLAAAGLGFYFMARAARARRVPRG